MKSPYLYTIKTISREFGEKLTVYGECLYLNQSIIDMMRGRCSLITENTGNNALRNVVRNVTLPDENKECMFFHLSYLI